MEFHPRNVAMANGFESVVTALRHESDRGSVVLAVAWLDESLTRIIKKLLKTADNETLLKPGQPLGDFGTKIILAERLQLINPTLVNSLNICRKLRNDFAHLSSNLSFETPQVKDRVDYLFTLNDLIISAMGETLSEAGLKLEGSKDNKISVKEMHQKLGTKQLFNYTCGFINSGLASIEFDTQQTTPMFTEYE